MKKTILLAVMAARLFAMNVFTQRIKGSDTCLLLTQTEAEDFMNKGKVAKITVTGDGSGVDISALTEDITDVAVASHKVKSDERMKLQGAEKKTKEEVIAYNTLAVIVHPSNKVSNLARGQLEGIFIGEIKSWKEMGGADMKVVAYSHKASSETYEFFKESVLKNKNYTSGVLSIPVTDAIIQSVSQTKGATGYVDFTYLNKEVKPIHVSYNAGKSYVEPSLENARNRTYPVARLLFCYCETENTSKVRLFTGYVMSAEEQATVKRVGYIPVK